MLHPTNGWPAPAAARQTFNKSDALKAIFSEYGDVVHCYIPRSPTDPTRSKGFAFVGFKHSFAADA